MKNVNFNLNLTPSPLKAVIAIALGCFAIFASDLILKYIVVVAGVALVFTAGSSLATTIKYREYNSKSYTTLRAIEGGATALFGFVLVGFPALFISILMLLLGFLLLLAAIDQFATLARARKVFSGVISGWAYLFPSLILVASIAVILNPFTWAEVALMIIFGSTLLTYGITSLFSYFIIKNQK